MISILYKIGLARIIPVNLHIIKKLRSIITKFQKVRVINTEYNIMKSIHASHT